jgi:hypothetical protein
VITGPDYEDRISLSLMHVWSVMLWPESSKEPLNMLYFSKAYKNPIRLVSVNLR